MTKPWNIDLQTVKADHDGVFVDYKDNEARIPCGAKFKVKPDTIKSWIAVHKQYYSKETIEYEEKTGTATLKVKKVRGNRLVINFYDSGVIIAQGESCLTWGLLHVQLMKETYADTLGQSVAAADINQQNTEEFQGANALLSNFHHDEIIINKTKYTSVESAYQAEKHAFHKMPTEAVQRVAAEVNPYSVKELGNEIAASDDWEKTKVDRMFNLFLSEWTRALSLGSTYLQQRAKN